MLKRRFSVTVQIKRKDLNQGIKSKQLKLKFEKKSWTIQSNLLVIEHIIINITANHRLHSQLYFAHNFRWLLNKAIEERVNLLYHKQVYSKNAREFFFFNAFLFGKKHNQQNVS